MMNLRLPDIHVPIPNAVAKVVVRDLSKQGDYHSYELLAELYNEINGSRLLDRDGKYFDIFRRRISVSQTMLAASINTQYANSAEAMAIERGYQDIKDEIMRFCYSKYPSEIYIDNGTAEIQYEIPELKNMLEDLLYE